MFYIVKSDSWFHGNEKILFFKTKICSVEIPKKVTYLLQLTRTTLLHENDSEC